MNEPREPESPEESPAERESWERMTGELRAWANDPVESPPLDMAALDSAIDFDAATAAPSPAVAPSRRRTASPPALAWNLAAAAMLMFALSQTSFTLRLGEAEWRWGKPAPAAPPAVAAAQGIDAAKVAAALDAVGGALNEHDAWLADLTEENRQLAEAVEQSHAQLVNWQRTESTTRYDDVARLISMFQSQTALIDHRLISLGKGEAVPVRDSRGQ